MLRGLKRKKNKETVDVVDTTEEKPIEEAKSSRRGRKNEPVIPEEFATDGRFQTRKGKIRTGSAPVDKQLISLQEMIEVKDVWNNCFSDSYGQYYPALVIGAKSTDLMSVKDLYLFTKEVESAMAGMPIDSYQVIVAPMPFDIGAWKRNNDKIREEIKLQHEYIKNTPMLVNENPLDFEDRIKGLERIIDFRLNEIDVSERVVENRITAGQITTKRSFLIIKPKGVDVRDIREVMAVGKNVVSLFAGTQLEVREATSQEARDLMSVLLDPTTPDIVNTPAALHEPSFNETRIKQEIVLNEEHEMDHHIYEYTNATKEEARKDVLDRENNLIAFDGESQLKYPHLYPDAVELGAPTQDEVEKINKEMRDEKEALLKLQRDRTREIEEERRKYEESLVVEEEPDEEAIEEVEYNEPIVEEVEEVEIVEEVKEVPSSPYDGKSESELQEMINEAIDSMDYEKASEISDYITSLRRDN